MKLIIILCLFSVFSAHAEVVECLNKSLYWEEDSLSLDLEKMSGIYFDNDTNSKLECTFSELKEEKGYIYCHKIGDPSRLATRIKPNGSATVLYSFDQWIDFQCSI